MQCQLLWSYKFEKFLLRHIFSTNQWVHANERLGTRVLPASSASWHTTQHSTQWVQSFHLVKNVISSTDKMTTARNVCYIVNYSFVSSHLAFAPTIRAITITLRVNGAKRPHQQATTTPKKHIEIDWKMTAKKTVEHTKRYLMWIIIFVKCFACVFNEMKRRRTKKHTHTLHLQHINHTHSYTTDNTQQISLRIIWHTQIFSHLTVEMWWPSLSLSLRYLCHPLVSLIKSVTWSFIHSFIQSIMTR